MRRMTTKLIGTCAALMLSASLASAQAPDTKDMTIVTFSAPVALPGITLPAGSYTFQIADSQVNRNIVQVFNKDRSKILATILAIPAERQTPADDTVITFKETPANSAPAIQYWYYPGSTRGQEFAYPKTQAQQIANATHNSVLSVDTDETSADAMKSGTISRLEPEANANASAAQTTQPSSSSSTANRPNAAMTTGSNPPSGAATTPQPEPQATTPSSSASAQPSTPSPAAERTPAPAAQSTTPTRSPSASATPSTRQGAVGTSGTRPSNLPKTASSFPLVGFFGLLTLVSAFGVRALRRAEA